MNDQTPQQKASLKHHQKQKEQGIKRFTIALNQSDIEELETFREKDVKGLSGPISKLISTVKVLREKNYDLFARVNELELPIKEAESKKIVESMHGVDKDLIETVLIAKKLPLIPIPDNVVAKESIKPGPIKHEFTKNDEKIPDQLKDKEGYKLYLYENVIKLKNNGLSSAQISEQWNSDGLLTETGLEWTTKNITRIHKTAKDHFNIE